MAAASAISRLLVYVATCGATIRLRGRRFREQVREATFVLRGGSLIPAAAILISLAILFGATPAQLRAGAYAFVAGAVLYLIAVRGRRQR
jgi:amino acid transporter